jgi:iron uptake system EfeUOB component EfeO/EfeM
MRIPMTGLRATKLALLLAATTLITGCSHTKVVGADRTVQIQLSEYRLTPESIRVSGGLLTIIVHNHGLLDHNLVLFQNGQTVDAINPLSPGETSQMTLYLSPGTYSMVSTVLTDQSLGAYGTLRVTK